MATVNEKMTAIADAIRDKTGGTDALTLDGMATEIPKVYEAGKQVQNDEFWDVFQNNGEICDYTTAFSSPNWNDNIFQPKHNFVGSTFYRTWYVCVAITKIEKVIDGSSVTATSGFIQTFSGASRLVSISKIVSNEEILWDRTFYNCGALAEIRFEGAIGNDISFAQSSKLTSESVDSIIDALKQLTDEDGAKTITFHSTVKANMTDTQIATIQEKGWTLA